MNQGDNQNETDESNETAAEDAGYRQPNRLELNDAADFIRQMYEIGAFKVCVGAVMVEFQPRRDYLPPPRKETTGGSPF